MSIQVQSDGYLRGSLKSLRRTLDKPEIRAKYTDTDLLQVFSESWVEVVMELYGQAQTPPLSRFDLTVGSESLYQLPPTVGEVVSAFWLSPDGLSGSEVRFNDTQNSQIPGLVWEGPRLIRFLPNSDWATRANATRINLVYIPSGNVVLHLGKIKSADMTTTTVKLAGGGTILGEVDRRPNAYTGGILRVFGHENAASLPTGYEQYPIQERMISSYQVGTKTCEVLPALDFNGSLVEGDSLAPPKYHLAEVIPAEFPLLQAVVTKHAAAQVALYEGERGLHEYLRQSYTRSKGAMLGVWSNYATQMGRHYVTDVRKLFATSEGPWNFSL